MSTKVGWGARVWVTLIAAVLLSSSLGFGGGFRYAEATLPTANGVWSGDWFREAYGWFASALHLDYSTAGKLLYANSGKNVTSSSIDIGTGDDLNGVDDLGAQNVTTVNLYANTDRITADIPCSYLIWNDTLIYAKNGETGAITSNANAATLIQDCLNAVQPTGGTVYLKTGTYDLGSTQLVVWWHSMNLIGEGSDTSSNGVILRYSGTDAAVLVSYTGGGVRLFNNHLEGFLVQAYGAAITSATAIGVKVDTVERFTLTNVITTNFKAGKGLYITAKNEAGGQASIINLTNYQSLNCKGGIHLVGFDASHAVNVVLIINPSIIGVNSTLAGGNGIQANPFVYGLHQIGGDIESIESGYYIESSNNVFDNIRTEDIGFAHVQLGGDDTVFINPFFVGGGIYTLAGTHIRFLGGNYILENHGAASVYNTNTTVTIAHGMSLAPTCVSLSATWNGGAYVTSIDATNIVVTFTDPTATKTIYWVAKTAYVP